MYKNKSILSSKWILKEIDERKALYIAQKNNLSIFLSKLISLLEIDEEYISQFLNPNISDILPDPFILKDMKKAVERTIIAIREKQKIGILADYDVDGSASTAILYKFLIKFNLDIVIKIPERLTEGYGPNTRILNEFSKEKVNLLFTLDCGTSAHNTFNNKKNSNIDVIVIDHHISEHILPNIYSLINPNRYDESNELNDLAAVGVTFIFLIALRKKLREQGYFKNITEPNLVSFLDLVALGTFCDVVQLTTINRYFVSKGLEVIKLRKSKPLTAIFDNSKIKSQPKSEDLGYILGPQINAASRMGYSSLPHKLLISDNISEIDTISRKLILYNEKRKLIENQIYNEAKDQIKSDKNSKFILIYGENWHNGVLGIVASRILNEFNKPTIVISFENNIGTGSARSITAINLAKIIIDSKNEGLLISGGGHSMAAGLKIQKNKLDPFKKFLNELLKDFNNTLFEKKSFLNQKISLNEINNTLLIDLKKLEPFGQGNLEPQFVFTNINIETIKIIKDKHILVFFKNELNKSIKGIAFNSVNTIIGDYLLKFKKFNFEIAGYLKEDHYNTNGIQIIIKDLMLLK